MNKLKNRSYMKKNQKLIDDCKKQHQMFSLQIQELETELAIISFKIKCLKIKKEPKIISYWETRRPQ